MQITLASRSLLAAQDSIRVLLTSFENTFCIRMEVGGHFFVRVNWFAVWYDTPRQIYGSELRVGVGFQGRACSVSSFFRCTTSTLF